MAENLVQDSLVRSLQVRVGVRRGLPRLLVGLKQRGEEAQCGGLSRGRLADELVERRFEAGDAPGLAADSDGDRRAQDLVQSSEHVGRGLGTSAGIGGDPLFELRVLWRLLVSDFV